MLKHLLKLNREYQNAKEAAFEQTVNAIESKPAYFFPYCSQHF